MPAQFHLVLAAGGGNGQGKDRGQGRWLWHPAGWRGADHVAGRGFLQASEGNNLAGRGGRQFIQLAA